MNYFDFFSFSKSPQSCYYMLNHVYWKNKKSTTASKSIINVNTDNKNIKIYFFLKAYNYIVSIRHQFFSFKFLVFFIYLCKFLKPHIYIYIYIKLSLNHAIFNK